MLNWTYAPIHSLPEDVVQQMLDLAMRYANADPLRFRAHLEHEGQACLFRQPGRDRIEGYFVMSEHPLQVQGRRALLLMLSAFYARPHLRGDPAFVLAAILRMLETHLRYPGRRRYAASTVCDDSFCWYERSFAQVWSMGHDDLPALERELLAEAGARIHGSMRFDPARGAIRPQGLRAWEQVDRPGHGTKSSLHRLFPDRAPGEYPLVLGELSLRNTAPSFRRMLRRMGRKPRARLATPEVA